jgi:hypothetical protein
MRVPLPPNKTGTPEQPFDFFKYFSSLNETQQNILLLMMENLNSISSEDTKNYIKKAFEEINLAT